MGIFSKWKEEDTERLQRAKALYDQGQKQAALEIVNEEIRENPKNLTAYNYRASIYNRLHRYDESVADYTHVLEFKPKDALTYYYRGNSYYMGDKYWEAVADMKRSLALDPTSQRARDNLSIMEHYIAEKKIPPPGAAAAPQPAAPSPSSQPPVAPAPGASVGFLAALTPEQRTTVSNLDPEMYEMVLAAKQGGYTGVNFVSAGSSGPPAEAGTLLFKLDRTDLERLAESVRYTIRADAAKQTDMREAARLYLKAAELNPYDDVALMSYAAALVSQGKVREALPWAEKAAQVNPRSERTRSNFERLRRLL